MKKSIIGLYIGLLVAAAPSAHAEEENSSAVEIEVTIGASSRYIWEDRGKENSSHAGEYTEVAVTSNFLTLDWWQRGDFAGGTYGSRGYGDEHNVSLYANKDVCGFDVELYVSYWIIAPFSTSEDDMIELYADLGRTFEISRFSVTPAVRLIEDIGIGTEPNTTLVRFRLPIGMPIPRLEKVSVEVDPSVTLNLSRHEDQYDYVLRPTASVVWQITDNIALRVDAKVTDHTAPEFDLGFVYKF